MHTRRLFLTKAELTVLEEEQFAIDRLDQVGCVCVIRDCRRGCGEAKSESACVLDYCPPNPDRKTFECAESSKGRQNNLEVQG